MNKAFEKIIDKLEEIRVKKTCNKGKCDEKEICRICVVDDAIEIVKKEAEQYNNGWISCSERLPKNDCYCLVTTSDMEIGIREYGYSKGFGWDGFERIIAWQPLPQPYQPKGE